MKKIIRVSLIIIMTLLMVTGCKESKLRESITRSEKAIKQFQNDEITTKELGEKLERASDYCKSYENEDEDWGPLICSNIYLYSYEATMDQFSNDSIDYKKWDKAIKELEDLRKRVK